MVFLVISWGIRLNSLDICLNSLDIRREIWRQSLITIHQTKAFIPAGNYMFKVSNRKTITRCEICSKLTMKTPERRHGVVLVSLLLTLNLFHFTPCSRVSIVNFEQVNADWEERQTQHNFHRCSQDPRKHLR